MSEPLTDEHLAAIEENRRLKFEEQEGVFPSADIKCLLAEVYRQRAENASLSARLDAAVADQSVQQIEMHRYRDRWIKAEAENKRLIAEGADCCDRREKAEAERDAALAENKQLTKVPDDPKELCRYCLPCWSRAEKANAEIETIKQWAQAQHDADGEVIARMAAVVAAARRVCDDGNCDCPQDPLDCRSCDWCKLADALAAYDSPADPAEAKP